MNYIRTSDVLRIMQDECRQDCLRTLCTHACQTVKGTERQSGDGKTVLLCTHWWAITYRFLSAS